MSVVLTPCYNALCIAEAVLKPQKGSPIPPEVVDSARAQVASALSSVHTASVQAGLAPKGDILSQPRGQPFFLTLLHLLAVEAKDVDCQYPLLVADGVPLGVDDDMLSDPGVWPTEEEL